jgi:hypothetical protein
LEFSSTRRSLIGWNHILGKLHRQFPIFFAYILFQVVQFAILFPIYRWGSSTNYFYAYWISAILCWIFGFKIIHEVFSDVFRPFPALKNVGTVMFRWAALVAAGWAFLLVVSTSGGPDAPLVAGMIALEKCVRFVQCALILFLLLFSRSLGVSWRQQNIGIALGYSWFAGVELLAFTLLSGGTTHQANLNLLNIVAYSSSLIVWITYAVFPASNTLPDFSNRQDLFTVDGGTF